MRAAALAVAVLLPSPFASGQEQYELSEMDRWEVAEPIDPMSPAGQLATARRALADGKPGRAHDLADSWIKRHEGNPMMPEAYLLRGDSLKVQKNYYQALFDYETVARAYPASETFVIACQRELEIATLYATGTKRKFLGLPIMSGGDVAQEALIRVQERLPGSQLAERAAMQLADYYFDQRKMKLAVKMYSIFLENHPNSDQVSKARRRLIYSHLATFKGPDFDAAGLHEARARLQELLVVEPANAQDIGAKALLTRIDESDAQKLLLIAKWYMKRNDPIAAELTIRRLVRTYPRSVATTKALRLMNDILPKLPPAIMRESPDYRALQRAMLGVEPGDEHDSTGQEVTSPDAENGQ